MEIIFFSALFSNNYSFFHKKTQPPFICPRRRELPKQIVLYLTKAYLVGSGAGVSSDSSSASALLRLILTTLRYSLIKTLALVTKSL